MRGKVIITGFKKFLKYRRNTTEEFLKNYESGDTLKFVLPVSHNKAKKYASKIIGLQPRMVIALGQKRTNYLELESFAVNIIHSDNPDSDRKRYFNSPVYRKGPMILKTNIDIGKLYKKLCKKMHVKLSFFAGTYVCNTFYYCLLFERRKRRAGTRIIFIHIPDRNIRKYREHLRSLIDTLMSLQGK